MTAIRGHFAFCLSILFFTAISFAVRAQNAAPKSDNVTLNITSKDFYGLKTDSGMYSKFVGDVVIRQGSDTLFADSAYENQETKNFEAWGNVTIIQANGTQAKGDYLKYVSGKKMAYMHNNVSLTDGKNTLWCTDLTYDLNTKVGTYTNNGTLQSDATTVSSTAGIYYVKTHDAHFTGNVLVTDPQYKVTSDDLMYNTETKFVTFFPPKMSVVTGDKSVLYTTSGTYDSKNRIAHFTQRSAIQNDNLYLEGDSIYYNKTTGYGVANGRVISIDTAQHSTLYCGHAEYFRQTKVLWATIKPVLKQMNGTDSIFIRADTFYSAPIPKKDTLGKNDSVKVKTAKATKKKNKKEEKKAAAAKPATENSASMKPDLAVADTNEVDSTTPRYYIGYHHVLIFSDSLQGACDSISYVQTDSAMRMMYEPIAWSHKSQITGDTILLHLDSNKLKFIYVPNNATVVSQTGPLKAGMFDQIQGKTLKGFFENNEIHMLVVKPNAESINFPKDDGGAYMGASEATSEIMKVYFKDQNVNKILLIQDPKQTMSPFDKINISTLRLSRFSWQIERQPKSREELFR